MAETETAEAGHEHLAWADGLRALAALAVLGFEILRHSPNPHWSNPVLQRAAWVGAHGFDALLVLSGLLLALPVLAVLRRTGRADFNLARFAAGRALRILPVYYLVLAATVLVPLAAATYGIGGLSHTGPSPREAGLQALFSGNGLDNNGFQALSIQVRLLAIFPVLLAVYVFAPAILGALAGLALYLDYATPLHHWGAGAAPALMLGIVAADLIARGARVERFAWPLVPVAAAAAFALDPVLAGLPGPASDASFLIWNPLWAVAAAALAVACAQRPFASRVLGAPGLRQLAGLSYALVLVSDPLAGFVLARVAPGPAAPFNAAGVCLAAALVLWLLLDRTVATSRASKALLETFGGRFGDAALMALGAPRPVVRRQAPTAAEADDRFGPLPTMHPGMLATVSHRVGSSDDLRAEIDATIRRLAEAAATFEFFEPAQPIAVPEQLVLARESANPAVETAPEPPLEGVLLPPIESTARKVVTLAVGGNRQPQRPVVRVRFGPSLGGARAS